MINRVKYKIKAIWQKEQEQRAQAAQQIPLEGNAVNGDQWR